MASLQEKLTRLRRLAAKEIEARSISVIQCLTQDDEGHVYDEDGSYRTHVSKLKPSTVSSTKPISWVLFPLISTLNEGEDGSDTPVAHTDEEAA